MGDTFDREKKEKTQQQLIWVHHIANLCLVSKATDEKALSPRLVSLSQDRKRETKQMALAEGSRWRRDLNRGPRSVSPTNAGANQNDSAPTKASM